MYKGINKNTVYLPHCYERNTVTHKILGLKDVRKKMRIARGKGLMPNFRDLKNSFSVGGGRFQMAEVL